MKNNRGNLDLKEIRVITAIPEELESPTEIKNLFQSIDENHDNHITIKELKTFMRLNSEIVMEHSPEIELTKQKLENIYKLADSNGDGILDFDEFNTMMRSKENKEVLQKIIRRFNKKLLKVVPAEKNYSDYEKCRPPPIGILSISIIQIILFVLEHNAGLQIGDYLSFDPTRKIEIWRYFTYIFIHADVAHIVMNIIIQVSLGVSLEYVNRWWRIIILYIVGAIYGALWCGVFSSYNVVGASGAAFSLLTAHIAVVILNWAEMNYPLIQLFIFTIWTGLEVGRFAFASSNSEVAFIAHVGGMVAGLLMGTIILKNIEKHRFEVVIQKFCFVFMVASTLVGIILN